MRVCLLAPGSPLPYAYPCVCALSVLNREKEVNLCVVGMQVNGPSVLVRSRDLIWNGS